MDDNQEKKNADNEELPLNPSKEAERAANQRRLWRREWTSRLAFLLFFTVDLLMVPYLAQYVMYRTAVALNKSDVHSVGEQHVMCQTSANHSSSATAQSEWTLVQNEAGEYIRYLNVAELLPTFVAAILLGSCSDVSGRRKPLLWLPALGNVLYAITLVLDFYFTLPTLTVLYVGAFLSGISGGNATFTSGGASLLADTSSKEDRSKQMATLEMCSAVAMGTSNIAAGYWINIYGFEGASWFIFGTSILAFLLCLFVEETSSPQNITWSVYTKNMKETFSVCALSPKLLNIIVLYIISTGVYTFIQISHERIYVLYLETAPLCLDNIMIGWWLFAQGALVAVGTYFLSRGASVMKIGDFGMAYIGYFSRAAASLCLIFATNYIITFAALPLMAFQLSPMYAIRSMTSKLVSEHAQGILFGVMLCFQAFMAFLGPLILNAVFMDTLTSQHNTIFIISVCILAIPVLLTGIAKKMESTLEEQQEMVECIKYNESPVAISH